MYVCDLCTICVVGEDGKLLPGTLEAFALACGHVAHLCTGCIAAKRFHGMLPGEEIGELRRIHRERCALGEARRTSEQLAAEMRSGTVRFVSTPDFFTPSDIPAHASIIAAAEVKPHEVGPGDLDEIGFPTRWRGQDAATPALTSLDPFVLAANATKPKEAPPAWFSRILYGAMVDDQHARVLARTPLDITATRERIAAASDALRGGEIVAAEAIEELAIEAIEELALWRELAAVLVAERKHLEKR